MDGMPGISQFKSLMHLLRGDVKGAKETQVNFSKTCLVVSQCRSLVELSRGDREAALQTQVFQLMVLKFAVEALGETLPIIGHTMACVHYSKGDMVKGKNAIRTSTRGAGIIAGGIAGSVFGGPVIGTVAGGIVGNAVGGIATDLIITLLESVMQKTYQPSGSLASVQNVIEAIQNGIVPSVEVYEALLCVLLGPAMMSKDVGGIGGMVLTQHSQVLMHEAAKQLKPQLVEQRSTSLAMHHPNALPLPLGNHEPLQDLLDDWILEAAAAQAAGAEAAGAEAAGAESARAESARGEAVGPAVIDTQQHKQQHKQQQQQQQQALSTLEQLPTLPPALLTLEAQLDAKALAEGEVAAEVPAEGKAGVATSQPSRSIWHDGWFNSWREMPSCPLPSLASSTPQAPSDSAAPSNAAAPSHAPASSQPAPSKPPLPSHAAAPSDPQPPSDLMRALQHLAPAGRLSAGSPHSSCSQSSMAVSSRPSHAAALSRPAASSTPPARSNSIKLVRHKTLASSSSMAVPSHPLTASELAALSNTSSSSSLDEFATSAGACQAVPTSQASSDQMSTNTSATITSATITSATHKKSPLGLCDSPETVIISGWLDSEQLVGHW